MRLLFVLRTDSYEQVFGEGLRPGADRTLRSGSSGRVVLVPVPNQLPVGSYIIDLLHIPCMARADTERAIAVPDRLKMVRGVTIAYCRYSLTKSAVLRSRT